MTFPRHDQGARLFTDIRIGKAKDLPNGIRVRVVFVSGKKVRLEFTAAHREPLTMGAGQVQAGETGAGENRPRQPQIKQFPTVGKGESP